MSRLLRIATLALCLLATGCAAQAVHTPTPTQTPFPCPFSNATPNPGAMPTALEVVRPYNKVLDLPAFAHCVTDAARVQHLYNAILALPPRAPGYYSCPKGWDVTYYLTFLAGANVVRMMSLEADGCRFLHLSDSDVRATDDRFTQLFADTIGLPATEAFP